MQQYLMPRELDYQNVRKCLDNYVPTKIYLRLMASMGGTVKVDETLEGRTLDILEVDDNWSFLIDGSEVIRLSPRETRWGVSMAYEVTDGNGCKVYSTTIAPDDPAFPEAQESVLRYDLEWHLLEITFKGRIPLQFHSEREGFKS